MRAIIFRASDRLSHPVTNRLSHDPVTNRGTHRVANHREEGEEGEEGWIQRVEWVEKRETASKSAKKTAGDPLVVASTGAVASTSASATVAVGTVVGLIAAILVTVATRRILQLARVVPAMEETQSDEAVDLPESELETVDKSTASVVVVSV